MCNWQRILMDKKIALLSGEDGNKSNKDEPTSSNRTVLKSILKHRDGPFPMPTGQSQAEMGNNGEDSDDDVKIVYVIGYQKDPWGDKQKGIRSFYDDVGRVVEPPSKEEASSSGNCQPIQPEMDVQEEVPPTMENPIEKKERGAKKKRKAPQQQEASPPDKKRKKTTPKKKKSTSQAAIVPESKKDEWKKGEPYKVMKIIRKIDNGKGVKPNYYCEILDMKGQYKEAEIEPKKINKKMLKTFEHFLKAQWNREEKKYFRIEEITGMKMDEGSQVKYEIKWKGYVKKSWIPMENLCADEDPGNAKMVMDLAKRTHGIGEEMDSAEIETAYQMVKEKMAMDKPPKE